MEPELRFIIPELPPTLNHSYERRRDGKGVRKTDELKAFEAIVASCIGNTPWPFKKKQKLEMRITFYSPRVLLKDEDAYSTKFGDTDNRPKHTADAVFSHFKQNDVHIGTGINKKRYAKNESTVIILRCEKEDEHE